MKYNPHKIKQISQAVIELLKNSFMCANNIGYLSTVYSRNFIQILKNEFLNQQAMQIYSISSGVNEGLQESNILTFILGLASW